jgi:hypothetical protein
VFVATENDDDFPIIAAMAAAVLSRIYRGDVVVRQRLNWNLHVKTLIREGLFKKMYQMPPSAFNKLLKMLLPWMNVDNKQSSNASKGRRPIVAEIILHCTLRYLAGGSVHDIRVCAGLSHSSFYRAVHRGLDAINDCPSLSINFPMTLSDLSRSAAEFKSISSHGIIDGCIAALDGWLCRIRVPSAKEVRKVTAYFSGHYQFYGLNVQATCEGQVLLYHYFLWLLLLLLPLTILITIARHSGHYKVGIFINENSIFIDENSMFIDENSIFIDIYN